MHDSADQCIWELGEDENEVKGGDKHAHVMYYICVHLKCVK